MSYYDPESVPVFDRIIIAGAFGATATLALFMPSVISAFVLQVTFGLIP